MHKTSRAIKAMVFVAVAAVTVGVSLVGCSADTAGETGGADDAAPYVFGIPTTLTGPAAYVGANFSVGVNLAVDEINENGGINGHPIKPVFIDDKGTPDGGLIAARQLVEQENALVILGGGTSNATVPVIPYFTQNNVPFMASVPSDPRISDPFVPNIFSGAPVPTPYAIPIYAEYIEKTLKAKTIAFVVCDAGFCTSVAPGLSETLAENGVKTVAMTSFTQGDTDFTGQAQTILAADPDVIFILGNAADDSRIIPQLKQAGISGQLVGDVTASDPALIEAAGDATEGLISFWLGGSQFIGDDTGVMADWLDEVEKRYPNRAAGSPGLHSLLGYEDTYVLAEAIRLAGDDVNAQTIITSLNENIDGFVAGKDDHWTFAEAIGLPRTFSDDNHVGNRTLTALTVKDGKFVPAE